MTPWAGIGVYLLIGLGLGLAAQGVDAGSRRWEREHPHQWRWDRDRPVTWGAVVLSATLWPVLFAAQGILGVYALVSHPPRGWRAGAPREEDEP